MIDDGTSLDASILESEPEARHQRGGGPCLGSHFAYAPLLTVPQARLKRSSDTEQIAVEHNLVKENLVAFFALPCWENGND